MDEKNFNVGQYVTVINSKNPKFNYSGCVTVANDELRSAYVMIDKVEYFFEYDELDFMSICKESYFKDSNDLYVPWMKVDGVQLPGEKLTIREGDFQNSTIKIEDNDETVYKLASLMYDKFADFGREGKTAMKEAKDDGHVILSEFHAKLYVSLKEAIFKLQNDRS